MVISSVIPPVACERRRRHSRLRPPGNPAL